MTGLIDNVASGYVLYKVISKISSPFNTWDAYKTGVIDDFGNVLVQKDKRNQEQRESFTKLDVMCRNLKRILSRLPGGDSKFATYSAALYLLKEGKDDMIGFKQFIKESEMNESWSKEKDDKRLEIKKRVKEKEQQELKDRLKRSKQNWDQ